MKIVVAVALVLAVVSAIVIAMSGTETIAQTFPASRVALWRLAGEGRGVPAIHDETMYVLSKRHEVLALNVETG